MHLSQIYQRITDCGIRELVSRVAEELASERDELLDLSLLLSMQGSPRIFTYSIAVKIALSLQRLPSPGLCPLLTKFCPRLPCSYIPHNGLQSSSYPIMTIISSE